MAGPRAPDRWDRWQITQDAEAISPSNRGASHGAQFRNVSAYPGLISASFLPTAQGRILHECKGSIPPLLIVTTREQTVLSKRRQIHPRKRSEVMGGLRIVIEHLTCTLRSEVGLGACEDFRSVTSASSDLSCGRLASAK